MTTSTSSSIASDLCSTCYLIRQQTASQITAQLQQLSQHTALQMANIRQQERTSSAAQRIVLDQLRPHLAIDARLLLSAAEFADFVQDLKTWQSDSALSLQVQPQPKDWILPTLTSSLELHDIDTRACVGAADPCACETQLSVQVEFWQQTITFPTVLYGKGSPDAGAAHHRQWAAMRDALTAIASRFETAKSQQKIVEQELYCLLSFVGELFNLRELANAFHPQVMPCGGRI